jgi:hypothetical protein
MERRRFTREFKPEAVKLIKERGVGYVQATRGVSKPIHRDLSIIRIIRNGFAHTMKPLTFDTPDMT